MIYDTARSIKPDALVEFCPCGTSFNFYTLPNLNMSVASDPHNSWQVRTKGKDAQGAARRRHRLFRRSCRTERWAPGLCVHAGNRRRGRDAVHLAGRFRRSATCDLTPEKEEIWQKWVGLYKEKMLSRGEYLGGLYDIGFDRPEAHAIRKSGKMYYAFYAPQLKGKVELRGLERRTYRVHDYENDRDLGIVRGPTGSVDVQFTSHLLLEAKPQ